MGAHSASGHHPVRTATATAGVAAALVTTATGVLSGGTALASESHGSSGHTHEGHGSHSDRGGFWGSDDDIADADPGSGFAQQTLCDVLDGVDLGNCSSGGGHSSHAKSSDDSGSSDSPDGVSGNDTPPSSGLLGSAFPGQSGEQPKPSSSQASPQSSAPAAQAPKPAPKPTSSVPNRSTVQPITGPSSGAGQAPPAKQVVPIANG
ncbi:hypothetical protein LQ327_10430 [Actinomycetospora endophytica]|uniref:Uncharacterized protein n=1 Tax=Actinomycetospora endophytica TaxID=2291215 RepID=A0ABS8P6D4_9PSEU|nr:hypothetical protein [Actinomycetospora endophytica]MCD2193791.1 hypothetical protein [Actinomycetospora endophytica]